MTNPSPRPEQGIDFGPFRLLPTKRLLEKEGNPVSLGSRALDILIVLVGHAGDVVEKNELISKVWPNTTVDESSLRVHMTSLRKALGDRSTSGRYIVNIPGRGYCFVAPITNRPAPPSPPVSLPQTSDLYGRLPPLLPRMIGRTEVIQRLSEDIRDRRLITIHGPGGIGKTTTATALAHALLPKFDNAVSFIDLGVIHDPNSIPGALVSALSIPVQSTDTSSAVVNFLRDRRMLLILDSCEHMIDPIANLTERIIQEALSVNIIATSREALRIEGEHVHQLSPLESPPEGEELTVEQTLSFPAAHLLIERATASNHLFEVDNRDAPVIAEICQGLDGIALAIELAAVRIGSHGLRETAELLGQRMKLSWRGRRTAQPRHQTMTAMLDWSYNLIESSEQTVLRRLSVFTGSFTLDAAQAVAADDTLDLVRVTNALEQLVSKSLVSTSMLLEGSIRYRLLDTTRAYASAKLEDTTELTAIKLRHSSYWLNRLQRTQANRAVTGYSPGDDIVIGDLGNIRAALEHCFSDSGDAAVGVVLAAASAPVFITFSLLSECCRWTEQALSVLTEEARGLQCEMELQAAYGHSVMFTRGNSNTALAALTRALQLAEALNNRFYQFRLLSDLHMFRLRTGRFHETLVLAERAKAVADEIGDPVGLSAAHRLLSNSHHLVGDQIKARSYLEIWQPPPSQVQDTSAFNASRVPRIGLSRVLWIMGYPDQAVEAARKADLEAINVKSPVPVSIVNIWGSSVLGWIGDWDAVNERAERLIKFARKYSLEPHINIGHGIKGAVLIHGGEIDRGIELLHTALLKLRADRYEMYAPGLSLYLAEGLEHAGRLEEALSVVDETIAIVNSNGGSAESPEFLRVKGAILVKIGNLAEAEVCLRNSLDLAERQSALSWQLRTSTSLANLKISQGSIDEARTNLSRLYNRFTEGFQTSDLIAAKRVLDAIDPTPVSKLKKSPKERNL
ncbi:winged helix-turn-helix domain-containing protein [Bradyrhizobium sp. 157]|nr:winged helix-turn-helix domain-containing protein [Bradyrhizobium sp. 157]